MPLLQQFDNTRCSSAAGYEKALQSGSAEDDELSEQGRNILAARYAMRRLWYLRKQSVDRRLLP